jgi:hypothetical protein
MRRKKQFFWLGVEQKSKAVANLINSETHNKKCTSS